MINTNLQIIILWTLKHLSVYSYHRHYLLRIFIDYFQVLFLHLFLFRFFTHHISGVVSPSFRWSSNASLNLRLMSISPARRNVAHGAELRSSYGNVTLFFPPPAQLKSCGVTKPLYGVCNLMTHFM